MKYLSISISIMLYLVCSNFAELAAQKYFTKEGHITFESEAPLEKIVAENKNAMSVFDATSGNIEFAVLIKSFFFEKSLMQEHFNENYMESSKYPKSIFKGQVTNLDELDLSTDGNYKIQVEGDLSIHGVTNHIETTGNILVKDGQVKATSTFNIAVADYKIEIPKVVRENIAKEVVIKVDLSYQLLEQ